MQNIKLIVTDMDGTLLKSDHSLSSEFKHVYEELKQNNILFVPASGRQYFSIISYFEDIKDELAVIAENGTFVTNKGEEIFVDELDSTVIHKIIEKVRVRFFFGDRELKDQDEKFVKKILHSSQIKSPSFLFGSSQN